MIGETGWGKEGEYENPVLSVHFFFCKTKTALKKNYQIYLKTLDSKKNSCFDWV